MFPQTREARRGFTTACELSVALDATDEARTWTNRVVSHPGEKGKGSSSRENSSDRSSDEGVSSSIECEPLCSAKVNIAGGFATERVETLSEEEPTLPS